MKCDECKNLVVYNTGMDEYPPCTSMPSCAKHHWHGGPIEDEPLSDDPWRDCPDFIQRESTNNKNFHHQ